ncbi:MAG: radical SAM protein [Desulfovibrio sp.]|nr:radical SAM protein [Desulfovibrio sp.]
MRTLELYLPSSFLTPSTSLYPFFIPFRGCPNRCLFCAQESVTGKSASFSLETELHCLEKALYEKRQRDGKPCELAFYGGTFTALEDEEFRACVKSAERAIRAGLISHYRCSTRPDRLSPERLSVLAESGCRTIELGVQSFDEESLDASRRGYSGRVAEEACETVLGAGFQLGVQLLPGMPASTPASFLSDVTRALSLSASFLRFYPCLVFDHTGLAERYRKGEYRPWDLEITLDTLAEGFLAAWRKGVPVIRIGLLVSRDEEQVLLAGPRHPSLGARIRARALFLAIRDALRCISEKPLALFLPRRMQGFFWGDRGEMEKKWRELGFARDTVHFVSEGQNLIVQLAG